MFQCSTIRWSTVPPSLFHPSTIRCHTVPPFPFHCSTVRCSSVPPCLFYRSTINCPTVLPLDVPLFHHQTSHCSMAGLKYRSQVTGHRSGHRSQVTGQVTCQTTSHRSDHRSHTKTMGHWTKLFLIDILLNKNKTSQGTSIIFFLFWTLPNPTHEKIYSCWSRKEDLRYSVTKVGNEITKVRKITWFVRKNESQNEGLLR